MWRGMTPAGDGTVLKFGTVNIDCKWQPVSFAIQELAAAKDWMRGIALSYQLPRGQVLREGLAKEVARSRRTLRALVRRTANALAPTGVTLSDVEALVERRLEERYAGPKAHPTGRE